jgi:hypothetical protein
MSLEIVEIRSFSGPSVVEVQGSDEPSVVLINQGPSGELSTAPISTATDTALIGYIFGNGTKVAGATAGSASATTNTIAIRNASGNLTANAYLIPSNGFTGTIDTASLTASRAYTLPDKAGSLALTQNANGAVTNTEFYAKAAVPITAGQAVYISGASGANKIITLAQANTEAASSKTIGLALQNLATNGFGYVVSEGDITGLSINLGSGHGVSEGDPIWLSPTTPGGLIFGLANKPSAPNHLVFLGYVTRINGNTLTEIFVKVQNGFELGELHNVAINGVADSQVLTYESSTGLWKNKPTTTTFSQLHINNPSGDSSIEVGGSGQVYIDLKKPNSDDIDLRITTDGTDGVIDSAGGLLISTANNERMCITSAGNVGIGTATPTAKLNVVDNSSSDALRITQTGSGNALVVEDSTHPDSTPFKISSTGQVFIGGSGGVPDSERRASIAIVTDSPRSDFNNGDIVTSVFSNEQESCRVRIRKGRGTISAGTIVQDADKLGTLSFAGYNGVGFIESSQILGSVDGVPSINNIPSRLTFNTTGLGLPTHSERMRITSTGNVGIGTSSPSSKLHVAGDLTMSSATVATSATAGTNGDVPAQVAGYLVVNINGTAHKIPYYA